MSVGQKMTILKIGLMIVTLMILGNLKAAPEKTATQGSDGNGSDTGLKLKLGTLSVWEN